MSRPFLTIAFPVFRNFDGLYFSAEDIGLSHPEVAPYVEILVVDNDPDPSAKSVFRATTKRWVETRLARAVPSRYVHAPDPVGTAAAKQRCVDEAAGEFVLLADAHVRVARGGLARLIDFFRRRPETIDLYSGPMFYDSQIVLAGAGAPLQTYSTHLDRRWRGHDLGTWGTDPRGARLDDEPFEIPAMGTGLFACRRAAFPGFHPAMRGFGCAEYVLYEKVRRAGGRGICLPFLRWVHQFTRPNPPAYPLRVWDRVRNYVLAHQEIGWPLEVVHAHFVTEKSVITEEAWQWLVADPLQHVDPPGSPCRGCGRKAGPPEAATLEEIYARGLNARSGAYRHLPALRELAADCEVVVELGDHRGMSTAALLVGRPKRLVHYAPRHGPIFDELEARRGDTSFEVIEGDVARVDIEPCDLLFADLRGAAGLIDAIIERHVSQVRRWLVLYGLGCTPGPAGPEASPVLAVLGRFLQAHPEWSIVEHGRYNHSLILLSCRPEDKPPLPAIGRMAWNYAAALVRHGLTGARGASGEAIAARLARCAVCGLRNGNRCAFCGCYLDAAPDGRPGKAAWADSRCPLGDWEE